jgi:hypothetical protein
MKPLQTEPAITIGASVAALMGLLVYLKVIDLEGANVWGTFITLVAFPIVQAVLTRLHVFSPNTLREAGLNPKAVAEAAADPDVLRNKHGE